ncbi:MAG: hypothetical protein AN484_27780 [Aphanizomenon flos-aquae WA102]|uniref:Uncharacterized protein n=1 Tax=Aphanizomenon flos-aquae WA102 TaxID=1710896 RepID=A0A1B7W6H4_APHFL|nr:MAG: hypothetical protein AN484_27780 [Aphanizomenon flos-aquae WA102]
MFFLFFSARVSHSVGAPHRGEAARGHKTEEKSIVMLGRVSLRAVELAVCFRGRVPRAQGFWLLWDVSSAPVPVRGSVLSASLQLLPVLSPFSKAVCKYRMYVDHKINRKKA